MTGRIAARILAMFSAIIVLFQLALIIGAPWGQFTQGGYAEGALPTAGRILAAISIVIIMLFALGVLGRAGLGPWSGRPRLATGFAWASLTYSVLGFGMNLLSPSVSERAIWVPVTVVMGACAAVVLAQTRRRPNAK